MIPKVATEAFHWIVGITAHIIYLISHSLHETNLDHSQCQHFVFEGKTKAEIHLTLVLNMFTSFMVQESALPMTGMMLTFLWIFFITSTSRGFRPWPVGAMK